MQRFFFSWFAIEGAGTENEDFGGNSGHIEAENAEAAEAEIRVMVEEIWENATITIEIEAV